MIKLAILALMLIVGGAIIGLTTDHNPVLLIIAGFVCGVVAAFRETDGVPMRPAAASRSTTPALARSSPKRSTE